MIAAVAQNRAIGYQNKLIYWLPNDLKRFKALTTGHTIIMGRRTFESLPKGALPNRRNVVLSRTQSVFEGCDTYSSLTKALESCNNNEVVFIIGGESIYKEAIGKANTLFLTEINSNYSFLYVTKSNEKACFSSFSWCSLSVSIQLL